MSLATWFARLFRSPASVPTVSQRLAPTKPIAVTPLPPPDPIDQRIAQEFLFFEATGRTGWPTFLGWLDHRNAELRRDIAALEQRLRELLADVVAEVVRTGAFSLG